MPTGLRRLELRTEECTYWSHSKYVTATMCVARSVSVFTYVRTYVRTNVRMWFPSTYVAACVTTYVRTYVPNMARDGLRTYLGFKAMYVRILPGLFGQIWPSHCYLGLCVRAIWAFGEHAEAFVVLVNCTRRVFVNCTRLGTTISFSWCWCAVLRWWLGWRQCFMCSVLFGCSI